jgi:hypothetical protein
MWEASKLSPSLSSKAYEKFILQELPKGVYLKKIEIEEQRNCGNNKFPVIN